MLRIIAGDFRSRHLLTPDDAETTRPLPDRVRVAMFNMLHGHLKGEAVVDVFAGTGSFGLEALSRGAARAVFIEKDREIMRLLKQNVESLGVADRAEVFNGDALGAGALSRCPRPVHVVMFDPPYPMVRDPALRGRLYDQFARFVECLDPSGFAILRTPWPFVDVTEQDTGETDEDGGVIYKRTSTPASLAIPGVKGPETHAYGSTALHWYMRAAAVT